MSILTRLAKWFDPYGGQAAVKRSVWDDYWYQSPFGLAPETKAGAAITETSAMSLTPVWACVKLISEDVASLPLHLYQTLEDGSKKKAEIHPVYKLMHDSPNPEMTAMSFRETMMSHILTWGNAFAEIEREGTNIIKSLWPLAPNRVQVKRYTSTQELFYEYRPEGTNELVIIPKDQMLHIPGLSGNGLIGYSPITKLRESLGLAAAAEEFGARFFGQGTHMGLILKHPGKLSPEAANHLRTNVTEAYSGLGKTHRLMVLQEAMDVEKIGIPPNDAQFLQTRQFQIAEIARIYRVPLHMVAGDAERAKGWSTLEQQSLEYVKYCLRPWLVRLEQSYKRQLGVQSRFYFKHNIEGLLRADLKARTEYYTAARNWGWMNVDEIRELEDRNPLPDGKGQIYLEPLNMKEAGEEPPELKPAQKGNGEDKEGFPLKAMMPEVRCNTCNRLLFKSKGFDGNLEIKCPKCGEMNIYTESQAYEGIQGEI